MHITSVDPLHFTSRYKYKLYWNCGLQIFHVEAFRTENKFAIKV